MSSNGKRNGHGHTGTAGPIVLIVEPCLHRRDMLSGVCRNAGASVRTATQVPAALDEILHDRPSAVLACDDLPGIPGRALVAAMKSSPMHRTIPVGLICTAEEFGHEDAAVPRPDRRFIQDGELPGAVRTFIESLHPIEVKSEPAMPEAKTDQTSDDSRPLSNAVILMCEDTIPTQKLQSRILQLAGAEVVAVANGLEALEAVKERHFDLILMDLEMPEMDGREATAALRGQGTTVPIIAMSACDADEFRPEAMKLGFDDALPKPIARDFFVRACAQYLHGSHQGVSASPVVR